MWIAIVWMSACEALAAPLADWTGRSSQRFAHYGFTVASAGDVDRDGFDDVLIGVPGHSAPGAYGAVALYRGSAAGIGSPPAWGALGGQPGANLGYAISSAGDVDGDGYDDVILGSPDHDVASGSEGALALYRGGPLGLSPTPTWTHLGTQLLGQLGWRVAGAADVNGDGYDDVLASAQGFDGVAVEEGMVMAFYGGPGGLSGVPDWQVTSGVADARLGRALAAAGDVNGDGYDDVVAGSGLYTNGQVSEGGAFLYLGSSGGLSTTHAWSAEGDQTGANLGAAVGSAGDVNGDGYDDVIVGAPGYDDGESSEGAVWVYHGGPSGLSAAASWSYQSNTTSARAGYAVSGAGDVNGDGFDDVLVGSLALGGGGAALFLGGAAGLQATPVAMGTGPVSSYDEYGHSVAAAGDVNGDGLGDVLIGAPDTSYTGFCYACTPGEEGAAYLYLGR